MTTLVAPRPRPRPRTRVRGRSSLNPSVRVVTWVVGGLLIAAAALTRQAGTASWQTIWAEDGAVFYAQARAHGLASVTTSYSRYLQLGPRLLALPAAWVPVDQAARYLAVAAAIGAALASLAVFHLARTLIRSPWLRVVVAVAPILVPVAVSEVAANITNLIWPMSCATLWVLLSPVVNRRDALLGAALVGLTAMSQVLVVIFVPIALGVLWLRRDRNSLIVVASFLGGLIVQAAVYVTSSWHQVRGPTRPAAATWGYLLHVDASMLLGEKWLQTAWHDHRYAVGSWTLIVTVVLVAAFATATDRAHLWPGLAAIASSCIGFGVVVAVRGDPFAPLQAGVWSPYVAGRYTEFSIVLLLGGIAVLADGLRRPELRKLAIGVLAAQFALIAVVGFRATTWRSAGPSWINSLTAADRECVRTKEKTVAVSIAPPGWNVPISCADVH